MTDRASVTAIVLAGGRSARFGRQKLEEPIDGFPLLELAVRAVGAVADEIVLAQATAPPDPRDRGAASGGVPVRARIQSVYDPEPFGGPLVGLSTALQIVTTPLAVVVGGDMPWLQRAVLETMLDALGQSQGPGSPEAVVLGQAGGSRPLPCVVRVDVARPATAATLASGARSLRAMLERLIVLELPEAAWRAIDPLGETLIDVDTPADLDRIVRP